MRRAAVAAVRFHAEPDATSRAAKLGGCAAAASGRTTTEMPATAEAFRNVRRSTAPAIAFSMRRQLELGSRQQAFFISHDQHRHRHDDRHRHEAQDDRGRRRHSGERLTEGIGTQGIEHDPHDGRRGAGEVEPIPRHAIRAGEHGGHIAEKRQETSDEDEHAAVSHEEPLTDPDPAFRQSDARTIFHQQLLAELPADPIADDVTGNCRGDARGNQNPDIEPMGRGGEDPCRHQSGFAGQRKTDGFERDERRDQPDAVVRYERGQFRLRPRDPDFPHIFAESTRTSSSQA